MVKIKKKNKKAAKSSKLGGIAAGNAPLWQPWVPREYSEVHKKAPIWSPDQTEIWISPLKLVTSKH